MQHQVTSLKRNKTQTKYRLDSHQNQVFVNVYHTVVPKIPVSSSGRVENNYASEFCVSLADTNFYLVRPVFSSKF